MPVKLPIGVLDGPGAGPHGKHLIICLLSQRFAPLGLRWQTDIYFGSLLDKLHDLVGVLRYIVTH